VIKVHIGGLSLDPVSEQPVLLLVPEGDPDSPGELHVALPIWIGTAEAGAILLAVQGSRRATTDDARSARQHDQGARLSSGPRGDQPAGLGHLLRGDRPPRAVW